MDSGNFMGYPSQYLAVPDEFGFCFTQAFQAIGIGLYTAIGAAIARPDRLPVLGAGDGGFLMGISELETAVRLKLPLVCIVYNDAGNGAEVHHFGPTGAELSTVRSRRPISRRLRGATGRKGSPSATWLTSTHSNHGCVDAGIDRC